MPKKTDMPKRNGLPLGPAGTIFVYDAASYLEDPDHRTKLEQLCEKYGITAQLEPGTDHIRMWAEIGAALAIEHEGFGTRGRGRPKGTAGKSARDGFMADEDLVRFFEGWSNELGCSFDDLLEKGVDLAEQAKKIGYLLDKRANLRRLKRVKEQMDKERLRSTGRLGLLSKPPKLDKNDG